MKKIISIISALTLSLGVFTACGDYEYYEPAFYNDTIAPAISAFGGDYPVEYTYIPYESKSIIREFDFVYRVIAGIETSDAMEPKDVTRDFDSDGNRIYRFYVSIPKNESGVARPVLIEVSTHIRMEEEDDYWTDWYPILSTVQGF